MKTAPSQLTLDRWPYGLEVHPLGNGLLLRPRCKARAGWTKAFPRSRSRTDELAALRRSDNEFDAKEWEW